MDISLSELLKGKDEMEFSAYDIASKAHNRWSKKQFHSAALLFESAARVSKLKERARKGEANQFLNHYCRAGICYSQGGEFEKAKPFLESSIEADWIGAGLENDVHMIEWCYVELLSHEAKNDPQVFESLYQRAKLDCARLGWAFPRIHPKQEMLLEMAVDLRLKATVKEIVSLIRGRKPISRATRARLKEIEATFA